MCSQKWYAKLFFEPPFNVLTSKQPSKFQPQNIQFISIHSISMLKVTSQISRKFHIAHHQVIYFYFRGIIPKWKYLKPRNFTTKLNVSLPFWHNTRSYLHPKTFLETCQCHQNLPFRKHIIAHQNVISHSRGSRIFIFHGNDKRCDAKV